MSRRLTHHTLLCLGLFLFAFSISVVKPGLPATLKADEPAYFLAAMSLLHDGDLKAETRDFQRLYKSYPHLPTENLIVASDDGWETVYFGKPFIYPLLTVPLVALFGANGLVAFNMLLFVGLLWMGAVYLGRFNPEPVALLFSIAFFFLSPTFAYVFWLQPELLNMASVMVALFLVFHRFPPPGTAGSLPLRLWRRLFNESTLPLWSGALVAVAGYNKPVLGIVALPIYYTLWRRRGPRAVVAWSLAAAVAMALLAAGSVALTGHPTAYLGVARAGIRVVDPGAMGEVFVDLDQRLEGLSTTANSWSWMFDAPPFAWRDFFERLGYFFWGRHTGILLYTPFAALAALLLAVHRRRSLGRWLLLAAALAYGLFFLVKVPLNWHGGAGFVGNRYFINIYPILLFMVTAVRPLWLLSAFSAVGGLFLGTIVFTPFGAPVPKPTIQAHVRSLPYRYFPLELSLRRAVPGYDVAAFQDLTILGRKDVFKSHQPELGNMWLQGASDIQLWALSSEPLEGLFFEVRTWARDNVVELDFAGDVQRLVFEDAERYRERNRTIELTPRRVSRTTRDLAQPEPTLVYEFNVRISEGERIVDDKDPSEIFFLGAQLKYLGRRDQITRPEHYRLEWLAAEPPARVVAGELFKLPVTVRNRCQYAISRQGALGVNLSYHWFGAEGEPVDYDGVRTALQDEVAPGEIFTATMSVRAPREPGRYTLQLDAVRESIAWFSERGGATRELEIEVVPVGGSG